MPLLVDKISLFVAEVRGHDDIDAQVVEESLEFGGGEVLEFRHGAYNCQIIVSSLG